MSLKLGKLDVRCENISQFCPEGAFLKIISSRTRITRLDGLYEYIACWRP
ncbi:MAG: hypothetical protein C5S47_05570 [Candidatus Methanogasteraceae archaeon]|nr:MAG: hypothetical protein C5S47_05570 [ANME-2 cluster archaeon]